MRAKPLRLPWHVAAIRLSDWLGLNCTVLGVGLVFTADLPVLPDAEWKGWSDREIARLGKGWGKRTGATGPFFCQRKSHTLPSRPALASFTQSLQRLGRAGGLTSILSQSTLTYANNSATSRIRDCLNDHFNVEAGDVIDFAAIIVCRQLKVVQAKVLVVERRSPADKCIHANLDRSGGLILYAGPHFRCVGLAVIRIGMQVGGTVAPVLSRSHEIPTFVAGVTFYW